MGENRQEQREAAQVRRTSGLEDNHRRVTLRRAQGMHLASSLFSLNEIIQEPRLIAPPARVEPGVISIQEDIISQTLPYMPAWPELAAIYRAPTLSLAEAVTGGANIVIVGAAGIGKNCRTGASCFNGSQPPGAVGTESGGGCSLSISRCGSADFHLSHPKIRSISSQMLQVNTLPCST